MTEKSYKIEIQPDKKRAFLTVSDYTGLTKDIVFQEMIGLKITSGVILKNISRALNESITGERIVIARFKEPQDAVPEKIEFLIDLSIHPKEIGYRVDFYDLNYIKDVSKGTPVIRYKPSRATQRGYLVDGTPLLNSGGYQSFPVTTFTNFEFQQENDGWQLGIATIDGSLSVKPNDIGITNQVIVEQDLDLKTGNLVSNYSDIEIRGDVKDDFKIVSPAKVIILGNLENSEVIAQSLVVRKNIVSKNKHIHVQTLTANSIINRQNIYIEKLWVSDLVRNSEIGVADSAIIKNLTESEIFVNNRLEVDTAGSNTSLVSTVHLGVDKKMYEKQQEILDKINSLKKKTKELIIERVKTKNELDELLILRRKNDFSTIYDSVIAFLEEENAFLEQEIEKQNKLEKEQTAEYDILVADNCNPLAEMVVKTLIQKRTKIDFGNANILELDQNYGSCRIFLNSEGTIEIQIKQPEQS